MEATELPGLFRCEAMSRAVAAQAIIAETKRLRGGPADEGVYTVHQHIDCPPEALYEYLLDIRSIEEYTYSMRDFSPVDGTGLYVGEDATDPRTKIYLRITGNPEVLTFDYESAVDQSGDLWMVFCGRVLSAQRVQNRPGALLMLTTWRHPNYDRNPYPRLAPPGRAWPVSGWPLFHACDILEIRNLARIVEHRTRSRALAAGR
ncbi:SRPBCC family protein [Nocardia sp. CDC159]|uniref:SRPBCC family protein n=1 Tax=Nocardia pulmonis TaxID=2951408 RepID=A0A9X2E799_9NOCA|nr:MULTISPECIES: SRPBCC family protein [Nocardia]MCM6775617.1 SRPBCC family protein [Nocardia pulmonis]MCM6787649.1 SRPBCC family protein [Nocardia sp. CDC159]